MTYFDRIVEYVGKTDVILHILADEGEPPETEMLMISAKRYGDLTAVEQADGTSKAEVSDLPD